MDVQIKRALLSVSDKDGLVEFAKELSSMGVTIISTGGTAKTLAAAGIKVMAIDAVTGFPEMMDGRVKTLHPKIHGALLGIRDKAEHAAAMKEHGIEPIDLVCINLYPFEATIARPGCTFEDAIENIDIGGPSMVRSAAKNHRFVTVLTDPGQYKQVISEMRANLGRISAKTRTDFARIAFGLTASYDSAISGYLNRQAQIEFPERITVAAQKEIQLRYGENPHQAGAFYKLPASGEPCVGAAKLLTGGKEISFNNLMDANAAFELVKEFIEPAVVIVKHMNPCGCAIDDDISVAYREAYETDVTSAFGGIIAVNREIDKSLATVIMESFARFGKAKGAAGFFAEVIIAPEFDTDAIEAIRTLKTWGKEVRLLETGQLLVTRDPGLERRATSGEYDVRCIVGGLLFQRRDLAGWEPENLTYPTQKKPTPEQLEDLRIAWITAKHVKSNTIILAKNKKVIGVGAGQMNRVESGQLAFKMAGKESAGSAMASDAFFPFPDNVVNAAAAGVTSIIQPGGSKKDADVIAAADAAQIAMVFTGKRHFKH